MWTALTIGIIAVLGIVAVGIWVCVPKMTPARGAWFPARREKKPKQKHIAWSGMFPDYDNGFLKQLRESIERAHAFLTKHNDLTNDKDGECTFVPSTKTSSATICDLCGKEKFQHVTTPQGSKQKYYAR